MILSESDMLDLSLFHAQQAVEKSLKGLIAYYGFSVPKTHNIDRLLTFLEDLGCDTSSIRSYNPERLTKFSIVGRYPAYYYVSSEDRELIGIAENVVNLIKGMLGGCDG